VLTTDSIGDVAPRKVLNEIDSLCNLLQRRIARLMLQRNGIKLIFCAMLKVAVDLRIHGQRGMREVYAQRAFTMEKRLERHTYTN
jgi:hypothetical protein